jgi:hypothetical protein
VVPAGDAFQFVLDSCIAKADAFCNGMGACAAAVPQDEITTWATWARQPCLPANPGAQGAAHAHDCGSRGR